MSSNRKSGPGAGQKPISIRHLAVAALVLVAAGGVGMVIREYRFRTAREKLAEEVDETAQPTEAPKSSQLPKEPEIRNIDQPLPVEEVSVEPEAPASEPADAQSSPEAEQGGEPAQMEATTSMAGQESLLEDPKVKARRGREALAMIGHDPRADAVWIEIINDPSVSANARKNLIEDLNEDGLSYRNLTVDDLPAIEYRIGLVEYLRPYAMDKVNADAFDEAHKDLVNMANRLRR